MPTTPASPTLLNASDTPDCDPPGEWALARLEPGDHVRLCHPEQVGKIRFGYIWACVTSVHSRSHDSTAQHPAGIPEILHGTVTESESGVVSTGDLIRFHRQNILAIG